MSADAKAAFAALPVRVIGDAQLSALELRVLACIAFHDRMSGVRGKGQGAWASHETLAARVGCHYTRLSSAITKLAKLGYLEREAHPMNKRLRVYRVRYDEPADTLRNGKQSNGGTLCETANGNDAIVCRPSGISPQSQSDNPVEYISLSDGRYSAEAGKRYSAEAARLAARQTGQEDPGDGHSIGPQLAKLERSIKAGFHLQPVDVWRGCAEWLESVLDIFECGDSEYGRAQRLLEELETRIEQGDEIAPPPPARASVDECRRLRTSVQTRLRAGKTTTKELAQLAGLRASRLSNFMGRERATLPSDDFSRLQWALSVSEAGALQ